MGFGIANLISILFSLAAKQKEVHRHITIPKLTTIGYSGVLLGLAIIVLCQDDELSRGISC